MRYHVHLQRNCAPDFDAVVIVSVNAYDDAEAQQLAWSYIAANVHWDVTEIEEAPEDDTSIMDDLEEIVDLGKELTIRERTPARTGPLYIIRQKIIGREPERTCLDNYGRARIWSNRDSAMAYAKALNLIDPSVYSWVVAQ